MAVNSLWARSPSATGGCYMKLPHIIWALDTPTQTHTDPCTPTYKHTQKAIWFQILISLTIAKTVLNRTESEAIDAAKGILWTKSINNNLFPKRQQQEANSRGDIPQILAAKLV